MNLQIREATMETGTGGEVMQQLLQGFQSFRQEVLTFHEKLDKRMEALEKRMGALEVRMEALENRVAALEVRMEALEDCVEALEAAVGALRRSNQQLLGYIRRLGKMLLRLADYRDDLDDRLEDHELRLLVLEK
jgi:uncharacterized protein YaaN involved in tellurite resistance